MNKMKTNPDIFGEVPSDLSEKQLQMNPKVDFFFKNAEKWKKEFEKLRMIC